MTGIDGWCCFAGREGPRQRRCTVRRDDAVHSPAVYNGVYPIPCHGGSVSRHQPLQGFVVLIVEDDVNTLQAAATLVRDYFGCIVFTASSGMEALRMIRSGMQVDLVFSDVMMPGMDGLMLAEAVRQWLPDVAVVLATGFSEALDAIAQCGAVALLKPFSVERLEAVFIERLRIQSAA